MILFFGNHLEIVVFLFNNLKLSFQSLNSAIQNFILFLQSVHFQYQSILFLNGFFWPAFLFLVKFLNDTFQFPDPSLIMLSGNLRLHTRGIQFIQKPFKRMDIHHFVFQITVFLRQHLMFEELVEIWVDLPFRRLGHKYKIYNYYLYGTQ